MSSCEFFQTERLTSDVILQEELKAIDWHEVDAYPVFLDCKSLSQEEHLQCFVDALHRKVTHSMQRYAYNNPIDNICKLNILIKIDNEKNLHFTISSDSSVYKSEDNFQLLHTYIQEGLDSLQVIEPALKRGIPVTTEFALPVIFAQENE